MSTQQSQAERMVTVRNTTRSKYVLGKVVVGDTQGLEGDAPSEVEVPAKDWTALKTDKRYGDTIKGLLKSGALVEYV